MTRPARWRRFGRRAARGVRTLSWRDVPTYLRAFVLLIGVEAVIRWVRLPTLARFLGVRLDLSPSATDRDPLRRADLPDRERRSLRAAERVARHWPFGGGPCLRQSLVAARMIRGLDPSLRIGIADGGVRLQAHAWLEIDGAPLESVEEFVPFEIRRDELAGVAE